MQELICYLEKWQTLIGAFIGGIVGLLAALLVARDARKREQRAAAMLLVGDLAEVRTASEVLREMSEKKDMSADDKGARWITNMLLKRRPSLSPLFESSMVRIMSVDDHLAAHLILFKKIFRSADARLTELAYSLERSKQEGPFILSNKEIDSLIKLIASGFYNAVEHAVCAEHLLDKLIIRRSALLHRLMRKFKIPKEEKKCRELLKTGNT